MAFFPFAFSAGIALTHLYLFWNLRQAFGGGRWQYFAAALIAVLMLATIFRTRVANALQSPLAIDIIFGWAGLVLVSTLFTAGRNVLSLAFRLAGKLTGGDIGAFAHSAAGFRVALALGAAAFLYSLYEARAVRVHTYDLRTDRLPADVEKLRIVALSDLHLTRHMSVSRLDNAVALANAQQPDIVVLLGDTVDDFIEDRGDLAASLASLRARYGKFAIVGNHERYRGLEQGLRFLNKAGFTMLRGAHAEAGGITIAGVDDPVIRGRTTIPEALAAAPSDGFVLLLAHRPETPPEAAGRFDLQLSGHTHAGQVWPVRYLTWLVHGHAQGFTQLHDGATPPLRRSLLYLSNGTGYWGPPVRFLAPPEIAVFDLHK